MVEKLVYAWVELCYARQNEQFDTPTIEATTNSVQPKPNFRPKSFYGRNFGVSAKHTRFGRTLLLTYVNHFV